MLSCLHIIVDIGFDIGIYTLIVIPVAGVFAVAVISSSEKFLQLFRRKREREVLRHTLETSETSLAPLCMGSHIRISLFVEFIGIGGKDSMHTVSIVLPPFQAQVDTEVTPWPHLGCRIVTHIDIKSIDKTYLFKSSGIFVALDLHLEVVAQREGDASLLTLARHTKERVLIRRVADERYIAIGICLLVSIPVSIARSTKVWRIAEAYCW